MLIVLGVIVTICLIAAVPVIYIRVKRSMHMRRAEAKMNEGKEMDSTTQAEYENSQNISQDKFRIYKASTYTPVRQLSSPGYIAVYSPDKQGYSIYDEYDSDTCLDRSDSRDFMTPKKMNSSPVRTTPPVPLPPIRTCTLTSQSAPVPGHVIQGSGGQCPLTPPESDHELDMYCTVQNSRPINSRLNQSKPYAKNNVYTTAPRANPRSITATV